MGGRGKHQSPKNQCFPLPGPIIPQCAAPPAPLAPAPAEHQILWTLLPLVMQLNNQANYLGLVFLRIDNIGAYASLFNLHFTVTQQDLCPRTSAAPRLSLRDSKQCPARNHPRAQKSHQAGLGGGQPAPSRHQFVTRGHQHRTAMLGPGEQEAGDGGATGLDPPTLPGGFISAWLTGQCFPAAAGCRLPALHLQKNTHAPMPATRLCPNACWVLFFKKIENREVGYKISQSQLCVRPGNSLLSVSRRLCNAWSVPGHNMHRFSRNSRETWGSCGNAYRRGKKIIIS